MAKHNASPLVIEDGMIKSGRYEDGFTVLLHNGTNQGIRIEVDFTGMPVMKLKELAFAMLKVKFRPHVKHMDVDELIKAFNNKTLSWREMLTKAGSARAADFGSMSQDEKRAEILRLQASLKADEPDVPEDEDVRQDGFPDADMSNLNDLT